MAVTVQLPPEIEAWFLALAQERGVSLGAVVEEFIVVAARTTSQAGIQLKAQISIEEFDRILDEAAELVPSGVVLSDYVMSRESIYTREDEW